MKRKIHQRKRISLIVRKTGDVRPIYSVEISRPGFETISYSSGSKERALRTARLAARSTGMINSRDLLVEEVRGWSDEQLGDPWGDTTDELRKKKKL